MKHPTLVSNWTRVLQSYSFWFAVLGSLTFIIPYIAWEYFSLDLDPNLFGWTGFGFTLMALIGRFIAQPLSVLANVFRIVVLSLLVLVVAVSISMANPLSFSLARDLPSIGSLQAPQKGASESEIMTIAVPFLKRWEGVKLEAYQDVVGVWTICSGTTRGVQKGMKMSAAQCDQKLREEAVEYWRGVSLYLLAPTKSAMTPERGASWTSFAINVGIYAAGKSTATKRLNQGDITGACEALTWWNKAGGKIYRGLSLRRTAEQSLCLVGVRS